MKNYLFFDKQYYDWGINIKEINQKIYALLDYITLWMPHYHLRKDILQGDSQVLFDQMKIHDYFYITESDFYVRKKTDDIEEHDITETLPIGSVLISNARNEGYSVNTTKYGSIRENWRYYFVQPLGWATFYLINSDISGLKFYYLTNTGEQYNTLYFFNFMPYSPRWINSASTLTNSGSYSLTSDGIYTIDNYTWQSIQQPPMFFILDQYNQEIIGDFTFYVDTFKNHNGLGNDFLYQINWPKNTIYANFKYKPILI